MYLYIHIYIYICMSASVEKYIYIYIYMIALSCACASCRVSLSSGVVVVSLLCETERNAVEGVCFFFQGMGTGVSYISAHIYIYISFYS